MEMMATLISALVLSGLLAGSARARLAGGMAGNSRGRGRPSRAR